MNEINIKAMSTKNTIGGNIAHFTVKELHDKTEMAISRLAEARSELAQAEHSIPFYQKELRYSNK